MNVKTFAKLADQMDELAELFTAIGGTFRAAGDGGEEDGGDAAPRKKVRGAKPAATKKPADDAITQETVKEKLMELADAKGAATMKKALESVGAGKLSDVDEEQYEELIAKADELMAEEAPAKGKKPAAKKAKPEPIDFDDLTTKFKKLVKEDSAAAKKVLKANGIAKLSEVDQDDEDALKELSDAIDEALGGDEDALI